jgi:anti-sigma factor RsiW
MNCAQAQTYIECYVDEQLDPVTSARVEEHLHQCAGCQRALARLSSLRSLIKEAVPYHTAPDRLSKEIRDRINRERGISGSKAGFAWLQWLRPVALVAATAVVTWLVALQLQSAPKTERLASQIITSHARSTVTGHVTDVVSSEGHTVKPWLSSKLDFSPPVVDLSAAGFALVGGRLDYLDNRPVSVVVYRRRQHVIDLFVWPESEAPRTTPSQVVSRQGYQVLHWTGGGMTFWAISDLNAGEMKIFAENFSAPK